MKQPEALRLAEVLVTNFWAGQITVEERGKAAAELRRLHEVNQELVVALKNMLRAYVSLMENGRDRIVSLGGECDSVEVMEAGDPNLRTSAAVITKAGGAA